MNRIDNMSDYIFGTGLIAGVAPITGEAGVDASQKLSFRDFCDAVEGYLHEDCADNVDALREEFAEDKNALYAEYEVFHAENLA